MPTMIKAAVLHEIGKPLRIDTLILDDPDPHEVLIEVRAAGLCHSDLNYMDGKYPRPLPCVIGHEAAGVVLQVGSHVTRLKPGDHVIPLFSPECRECDYCESGKTNVCREFYGMNSKPRMTTLSGEPMTRATLGTSATHALLPESYVCKIRDDAPFNRVFYCGCGVTTGVGAAVFDAKVERGSSVVVFGLGGIGLNAIQGARLCNAKMIIAVDTNPEREAIARKFGATHFVNPKQVNGDLEKHLFDLAGGGADYAIECIGNVEVMRQAILSTHPAWGKTIIVGVAPAGSAIKIDPHAFLTGRRVSGGIFGGAKGRTDLPKVVDWYMNGDLNLDDLVTHTLRLEDINDGYDLMRRGESIRSVIEF